jgi:transcriptional regulator NrdR family protein
MRCPKCKSKKISVIDTQSAYSSFTYRYRKCSKCLTSWQTKELVVEGSIEEIKKIKKEKIPLSEDAKNGVDLIHSVW